MRIVFIGVVDIGWHCLSALLKMKANVVGIFTANKWEMVRKSGMHADCFRGFDALAKQWNVPLNKTNDTNVQLDAEMVRILEPDLIFCIGWPQIISSEILAIPQQGCIGIHPTLLPERRGGAPINWSLIDGLSHSGVTLFYFDRGVDSGDIIKQKEFGITRKETAQTVLNKVTSIAVSLTVESYPLLEKSTASRAPQDESRATYTRRRHPEDGTIDWRWT